MKYILVIQFFGGRGARAPLNFNPPNSKNKNGWSQNALMRELPTSLKEALGKKGKPLGMFKSAEGVNPYFSQDYREFSENCQRCVVAYELRRRGYNVEAQPTYENDKWPTNNKWRGAFRHAKSDKIGKKGAIATYENLLKKMKEYGNGARAIVSVSYKGTGTGHVFIAENVSGNVRFIEPQSKTVGNSHVYTNADIKNMFGQAVKNKHTTLTRVDNLKVSYRAQEFVWTKKRDKK